LRDAFGEALKTPAEAVILLSDGLPNPTYNGGLPPRLLIQDIVLANTRGMEIHAVTIGDYFKYKSTVEFMENLARANGGSFLALAQ
jgi:Mg-chelatase subunit ChlD